ncbi:MAG: efflux RND transporter permease subunit, partial [Verrucomicrobia bacterium]|nr:efflux RND transporter permease subunit [Verrucomicrobiota bacterium]
EDIDEPIIAKQEADAQPVMWIALNSEVLDETELSDLAENTIKDRLQVVEGVSSVFIGGQQRYAIRLWLDAEKMAAHHVTIAEVQNALRQQNVELPSGRVENLYRELSIQTLGELKTPEQFNNLVVKREGTTLVRLSDIGEARAGVEVQNKRSLARSNGLTAIGLGIVKQAKANTINVAEGIKAELEKLEPILPEGVETTLAYDESEFVGKSITEVWETLGIAFMLVLFTIFIFLRSLRTTLIPSAAIPVSIIAAFIVLYAFGYSINILTMLALVLAIGIVVDDAIVVLENIHRHVEEGLPPMQAALKSMDEIGFAIIAITLSLVAVFTPLAFQTSTAGRLFVEFAVAVVGAVLISAFISLTLTPMMAARVLKSHEEEVKEKHSLLFRIFDRGWNAVADNYSRVLKWALHHRPTIVFLTIIALATGAYIYASLEKEFLPVEDKGHLLIVMSAPEGSTLEYTDQMTKKAEAIVNSIPEAKNYFTVIGLAQNGPGTPNEAFMFVSFKDDRSRSVQDIVAGPAGLGARLFNEVPGAMAFPIIPKTFTRSFGQTFRLVIQHQDLQKLNAKAQELVDKFNKAGFLSNTRTMFELSKPELRVKINRDRANSLGVSVENISRTLQILFGGLDINSVKLKGKEYDVVAQLKRISRLTPSSLEQLYVRTTTGNLVQLNSVIETATGAAPNAIFHYNRLRSATIEGTPNGIPLGTAMEKTEALLKSELTEDFRYEWAGEASDLKEGTSDAIFVLILAIIIIYMVLAAQFESYIHPLTVMFSVPLAAIGAFGLIWLLAKVNVLGTMLFAWANYAPDAPGIVKTLSHIVPRIPAMNINLFSIIGLALLIGLVTKNGILLVEFANQRKDSGMKARDAMLEAGKVRLRPILMTSLTITLGILPIAIGYGAGAESRRPMGIAVVGGMITGTFLTLLVVPVIYTIFDDIANRFRKPRTQDK